MRFITLVLAIAYAASAANAASTCPPEGWNRAKLEQLQADKFEIADNTAREAFAESIVACTASPDPFLRDAIAFESLSHMLRAEQLGTPVRLRIADDLLRRITSHEPHGVEAPFAALILSEIVRADRVKPYLSPERRNEIAEAAIAFMTTINDYRGFDERDGWRHRVAHGADLIMQIARNPNYTDRALLTRLRDAVTAKIAPSDHAYVYGEPDRLLRPIFVLAQRNLFTNAEWNAWFANLADPAPFASWNDVFRSQAGLAKLHNTRAFLYAVWTNARLSEDKTDDVLLEGSEAALRKLP